MVTYSPNSFFERGRGSIYKSPPKSTPTSKPKNANQQAAQSMLSVGIGGISGKTTTSSAQKIQDRFKEQTQKDSGSTKGLGAKPNITMEEVDTPNALTKKEKIYEALMAASAAVGLSAPQPTKAYTYNPMKVYTSEMVRPQGLVAYDAMFPTDATLNAANPPYSKTVGGNQQPLYTPDTRGFGQSVDNRALFERLDDPFRLGQGTDTTPNMGGEITNPNMDRITPTLSSPVIPESPSGVDPVSRAISQSIAPEPTAKYTTTDGDTLFSIAEMLNENGFNTSVEEIAEINNIGIDGIFGIEAGKDLKLPTTRKPTVPTEFMDNETKAMLQETTPTKANFVLDTASSLANQLAEFTRKSKEKYTTGGVGLGDKDRSTYKVESGDTMYDIAKKEGVTLDKLMEANPDADADKIGVGQVINIPRGGNLDQLPSDVKQEVIKAKPKTEKDLTLALYDASTFKGIPQIKQGENLIEYFSRSGMIGVDEADPQFIEAFKEFGTGSNPKTRAWCANLLGNLIRKSGGALPFDNKPQSEQNAYMEGSQNFERLGKTIYNHNPNTGKTYKGKPSDVKAGDVIIFNNKLDGTRQDNGDFKYPNEAKGKGHISVVLEVRDDGSIVALGGNQSAGATSYITGGRSTGGIRASLYTPEIMKQYYKGGFKINRLTDTSLTQADPEIVAAIINDAGLGGDGR